MPGGTQPARQLGAIGQLAVGTVGQGNAARRRADRLADVDVIPGDAPLEQAVAEWRPRVQRALEGVEARAQAWEQRRADWRAVGRGPIGSETSP